VSGYLGPEQAPSRAEIDASPGLVLLEFGQEWCGFCRALAPEVERLLAGRSDVRHVKVEDGPGRPLGRSLKVRVWPNLVFLRDGAVIAQLARPAVTELQRTFETAFGRGPGAAA
jgi:thioredoxin 1